MVFISLLYDNIKKQEILNIKILIKLKYTPKYESDIRNHSITKINRIVIKRGFRFIKMNLILVNVCEYKWLYIMDNIRINNNAYPMFTDKVISIKDFLIWTK